MAKPGSISPLSKSVKTSMLIYGDPGIGKTRLIGTPGDRTLIVRPPIDHTDSIRDSNAEEWVVTNWAETFDVLDYMRADGPDEYDWVWLDSISLFQDTGLDDIWDVTTTRNPHRKEYGLDKPEYGINFFRLAQWVRHMVGSPGFNFGITAHPRELPPVEDPEAEEKQMPWIQGKNMSPKICGYMNIVAYMELAKIGKEKEAKRVLRTNASDTYYAKDQLDAFGGRMIDPTMPKIEAAIKKARGATGGRKKSAKSSSRAKSRRRRTS